MLIVEGLGCLYGWRKGVKFISMGVMEALKQRAHDTLRWSERFFKTDMVYLARGGFWQAFGQASSSIFSLILIVAFANLLPKETYGLYRYILSLAGILGIFTLTGMNRSVMQATASGYEGALKTAVEYQLKWGVIMMAGFWALAGYYIFNGNSVIGTSLLIMSFVIPLVLAFNTYGAYLEAKKCFRLNNIFSTLSVFIYVLGMLTAITLSGEIVWLVIAYSLTTLGSTVIFYFTTLKIVPPKQNGSGEVIKYGRQLTFIGLITPVVSQIDTIVITHFWGATQLALYTLALAIPSRATSFIKSLVDVGFPKIVRRNNEEIDTLYFKRILQGLSIGLICTVLYILIAPFIFKYLIPQYLDSIFYSQILSLNMIVAMPNRYHSLLFESRKFSKLIFTNSLTQNIIKILLYIILGIWGGLLGLVLAHVINSFISLGINIFMWQMKNKLFT